MPDPWLAPRLPLDDVLPRSESAIFARRYAAGIAFPLSWRRISSQRVLDSFQRRPATGAWAGEVGDGRAAIWLGPDEWLLIAEGVDPEVVAAEIEAALSATPHSLVDVSHRQVGIEVRGAVAVAR